MRVSYARIKFVYLQLAHALETFRFSGNIAISQTKTWICMLNKKGRG